MRRILFIVAACIAASVAPGGPPAAAQSPPVAGQAPQAAPGPVFRPVFVRQTRKVRSGGTARFVLDPVSGTRCEIALAGPVRGFARTIRGDGRLATITLLAGRRGTYRLSAACAQPHGPELRSRVTMRVRGARRDDIGRVRIRRSPFFEGDAAGRVKGKGAASNPFSDKQCTSWAWEKRGDVYSRAVAGGVRPSGLVDRPAHREDYQWNGKRWAENARRAGIATGAHPVVGALYVSTSGNYGHVAYVEKVFGDGTFQISERNVSGKGDSNQVTRRTLAPGRPGVEFVYGGPAAGGEYIGHIVQWDGDTKTQKTAWYVVLRDGQARRNWIPDAATYWCLKRRGAPGPTVLSSAVLSNQLPDVVGEHAACSDGQGAPPPAAPSSEPPPSAEPPPPAPPAPVTLTVYNKVTNGPSEMREDTPAYLSTVPQNFCKRDGCMIAGTERNTGGTFNPAVCQVQGARTTNGNDGDANDDGNPGLFTSTRWYGIRMGNGSLGYISEVWVDQSQRGGLNLGSC